ncbi:NAD(P)-binding domain-containing protein (plasmid) [Paraburkholderia sprentiae WSM5005]|uniref:NAD(P)-binding domain-containing protein n=1 Tax=Paraburkholderia sprentiae WSM5005 TaxID=754502 RepID=A0A1I9YWD6_9BURK|nr:NAD(P)-binding domain-containing protein [Paraburkholderia sprentiae]APA90532.1 NAD(P)-binding domain-containing protein [Paraburkholderia sprentiae WSM5005]
MQNKKSGKITLLGTGLMGSAMAKAMLSAGYTISVWNRTQSKCAPLEDCGATVFSSAEAAIATSDIIFLVISDYASSVALIADADLHGKTVVQLATGGIEDAVALEKLCAARGALGYMDVKVMTYPSHIGTPGGLLLASGRPDVFARQETLFKSFGNCRFVGEDVSAATTVMFAWSVHFQVGLAGVLESIGAAGALGVDPKIVFEIASVLGSDVEGILTRWQDAASRPGPPPAGISGTVNDYLVAADLILGSTEKAGVTLPVMSAVRSTFGQWADQGFGYADIEAAFQASRIQSLRN